MFASTAVIASEDFWIFSRENTSPGLNAISLRISSSLSTSVPESLTSETLYISPSLKAAVRYISRLSGLIVTSVESTLKSI